ncbi:MAG: hypothetical protein JWM05_1969 [Acidimicrobiales bacterium]|nr:hypothetical protein [Acidimicrobiales bacterium]
MESPEPGGSLERYAPWQAVTPAGAAETLDVEPTDRPDLRTPEPPPASHPLGAPTVASVPRRRLSLIWWAAGPVLVVAVAAISLLAWSSVPYIAISPGGARAVEPLVTVRKAKAYPASADILFTTVSVSAPDRTTGLQAIAGWLDSTVDVSPKKLIIGDQSAAQNDKFNVQLMTSSKDKAAKVALTRLGYRVGVSHRGAVVADLDPSLPVAEVLSPGDTVIGAAGKPVGTKEDLIAIIATKRPGDSIRLRVRALGATRARDVTARTVPNPTKRSKAMLGVSIETFEVYKLPVDIGIDSGKVGGPSAGLAFTLAILDRLTPGSITGGHKVAVTGTIEVNGSVGEIGGVKQKTEAAVRAGAQLFIVPPGEFADATKAAHRRIRIAKAGTLDQALQVLRTFGGEAGRVGSAPKPR